MYSDTAVVFFWIGSAIVFFIGLVLVAIYFGTQVFRAYVMAARDDGPPTDVGSPPRDTHVVLAPGTQIAPGAKIDTRLTKG